VDTHPGGPLAIAGFGLDAVSAVPLDEVVRHLDVLGAYEHYAAPALSDVLLEIAVSKHAVVDDLAGRPPTGCQGFFCKPPSDLGSFAVGACCQPVSQASSLVVLRGPATVAGPPAYWLSPTLAHRVPAQSLRGVQCGATLFEAGKLMRE
jgi:hypothetical protein